jgi:hypothetical protein
MIKGIIFSSNSQPGSRESISGAGGGIIQEKNFSLIN